MQTSPSPLTPGTEVIVMGYPARILEVETEFLALDHFTGAPYVQPFRFPLYTVAIDLDGQVPWNGVNVYIAPEVQQQGGRYVMKLFRDEFTVPEAMPQAQPRHRQAPRA